MAVISGYLWVIVIPLLAWISRIFFDLLRKRIERTPSHFISKTQSLLSNGLSTGRASIGLTEVGKSSRDPFCASAVSKLILGNFRFTCSFVLPLKTDSGIVVVMSSVEQYSSFVLIMSHCFSESFSLTRWKDPFSFFP